MSNLLNNKYEMYSFFLKISIIIYILLNFLSIFRFYSSEFLGGKIIYILTYLPVIIISFKVLYECIKKKKNKYHYYIIITLIFSIFYFIIFQFIASESLYIVEIGFEKLNVSAFQILNIIPVFFISYFVLQEKDIKFHKNIMRLMMIIFFINIILSLYVLLKDSNAIRILATAKGNEYYSSLGTSGFDITYSLVLIIPSLIYLISKCKFSLKIIFSLFFTITLIYIYKSSYTIAIIATILSICIYFFLSFKGYLRYIFVLIGVICAMWLLNPEFIYNTLTFLAEKIRNVNLSTRINDIANLIMFNDSTAQSLDRLNLYNRSIQAFLQSPILGIFFINPNYVLSGHSTILDILGGLGLVGFIPFIMILYYSYKFSIRYIKNSSYKKCIITSYIVFMFIATLNPQFAASTVMFTLLVSLPLMNNFITSKY